MLALFLLACGAGPPANDDCDLPATAADLAGPGATDCGFADMTAGGATPWACAVDAFEAGEPFFVVYDRGGLGDSVVIEALVSDGARVLALHQDQETTPFVVDGWDCVDPVVVEPTSDPYAYGAAVDYEIVECTRYEPEGNHYQVCGDICGPDECQPQPLPFERRAPN